MGAGYFDKPIRFATGLIASGASIEVRDTGGTLADIFSNEALSVSKSNPGVVDADGRFIFYADQGEYDITVGAGASAATYRVFLGANTDLTFSSRADLVSWWAEHNLDVLPGAILSDGTVQYVKDGGSSISDLSGLSPFGEACPDHFAENTAPGTTDMTGAINDLVSYTRDAYLMASEYLISAPIRITNSGQKLQGKGSSQTVISRATDFGDTFQWYSNDPTTTRLAYGSLSGLRIEMDVSMTNGAHLHLSDIIHFELDDVYLWDGFVSMRLRGVQNSSFNNTAIKTGTHWTTPPAGSRYVIIEDAQNPANETGEIAFNDFNWTRTGDVANEQKVERGLEVKAADGIWFTGGHIFGATRELHIEPQTGTTQVQGLRFDNVWFDQWCDYHVYITGTTSAGFGNFDFDGCKGLNAETASIYCDSTSLIGLNFSGAGRWTADAAATYVADVTQGKAFKFIGQDLSTTQSQSALTAGIRIGASVEQIEIIGNRFGTTNAGKLPIGIKLDSQLSSGCNIGGNSFFGVTEEINVVATNSFLNSQQLWGNVTDRTSWHEVDGDLTLQAPAVAGNLTLMNSPSDVREIDTPWDGRRLLLRSNTSTMTYLHDDAGVTTAAHKIYCPNGQDFAIEADGVAEAIYHAGAQAWFVRPFVHEDWSRYAQDGFDSRSEAVTWWGLHRSRVPEGARFSDGTVEYLKMPAGHVAYGTDPISDLKGCVPWGATTPNHFKENATPGTTDMSAGISSAGDYAYALSGSLSDASIDQGPKVVIEFLPQDYRMNSKVSFGSEFDGLVLEGNGAYLSAYFNGAMFRIGHDDVFSGVDASATATTYNVTVRGFIFRSLEYVTTTASRAIECGKCWNLKVEDNEFWNFDIGADFVGCGHYRVERNSVYIRTRAITTTAGFRFRGTYGVTGAGCHFHDNEISGNPSSPSVLVAGVEIKGIDGFYWGGNHCQYAATSWLINPTGATDNYANNTVIDVYSLGGNYADDPASGGSQFKITGTLAYATPVGNEKSQGLMKNIYMQATDYIRGAGLAAYGVHISVTDGGGYVTARDGIRGVKLPCNFEGQVTSPLYVLGDDSSKIEVIGLDASGATFRNQKQSGAAGGSLNYIEARSAYFRGCTFGAENFAPDRLINAILSNADAGDHAFTITDCDMSESTYAVEPFSLDADDGAIVEIHGNLEPSTSGGRFVNRSGSQLTSGYQAKILAKYYIGTQHSLVDFKANVSGHNLSTSTTLDRYAHLSAVATFRRGTGAPTAVIGPTNTLTKSTGWSLTPVCAQLAQLVASGTWTTATAYTAGQLIKNSSNVLYMVANGGTSGGSEPTATSGSETDGGGVVYLYLGAESSETIALIVAGQTNYDIAWSGSLEATQAG